MVLKLGISTVWDFGLGTAEHSRYDEVIGMIGVGYEGEGRQWDIKTAINISTLLPAPAPAPAPAALLLPTLFFLL